MIESQAGRGAGNGRSPESAVRWRLQRFQEFTPGQLYAVLAARVAVFVVEQDCPYQDLDGLDEIGLHLGGWSGEGTIAAYARILPPGTRFGQPSIGRVLTAANQRRTGLGRALMRRAIGAVRETFPGQPIRISAQCYLEGFYGSLGFTVDSAPYDEDGIPHVEMVLAAK